MDTYQSQVETDEVLEYKGSRVMTEWMSGLLSVTCQRGRGVVEVEDLSVLR